MNKKSENSKIFRKYWWWSEILSVDHFWEIQQEEKWSGFFVTHCSALRGQGAGIHIPVIRCWIKCCQINFCVFEPRMTCQSWNRLSTRMSPSHILEKSSCCIMFRLTLLLKRSYFVRGWTWLRLAQLNLDLKIYFRHYQRKNAILILTIIWVEEPFYPASLASHPASAKFCYILTVK